MSLMLGPSGLQLIVLDGTKSFLCSFWMTSCYNRFAQLSLGDEYEQTFIRQHGKDSDGDCNVGLVPSLMQTLEIGFDYKLTLDMALDSFRKSTPTYFLLIPSSSIGYVFPVSLFPCCMV